MKSGKGFTKILLYVFIIANGIVMHAVKAHARQEITPSKVDSVSNKMTEAINKKYIAIEKGLTKNAERSLQKFQKLEMKLKRRLGKKDSATAANLFNNSEQEYKKLAEKIKHPATKITASLANYVPGADSTQTAFKFFDKNAAAIPGLSGAKLSQLKSVSAHITDMQTQLQSATDIKQFIKERKQLLKEQFDKIGLGNALSKYNKQAYYYQQQVEEYRNMIKDPEKMEQKALGLIRELPAFREFMSKNSQLAQLFPQSASPAQAIQGLQTRASVQQQLTQQLGASGGTNPQQYLQQQVQQAQAQMDKWKEKINKMGGNSSDADIPSFTPNNQKTKSFWKRMEYGINIQSQRPNGLLPVTSDVVLLAGYKLSDKSTIGIGAGYKMGWGKNISNIKLTSQGMSLRSYLDIKLKGSIWISGGYEANFQQGFSSVQELKNLNAWQRSGLIGITKKYKIGKKNANMQLLWDFLSYEQTPRTQVLKWRLGYTF